MKPKITSVRLSGSCQEHQNRKFYSLGKKLFLIPIALFAMISCETGETGPATAHIYAVGNDSNLDGYLNKDGVVTSLGAGYYVADLFVQGEDVYTSGNKDNIAAYTKNGVVNVIGTSGSSATNIFVNGNDVYVVGKQGDSPAYWKNGVLNLLDIAPGFKGMAYDITISNNDVYIAGYQCNFDYTNLITNMLYWKNGVRTTVNSTHDFSFNWLGEISIGVLNNDVYLAVNERDSSSAFNGNAYLIKNGTEETLIDQHSEVHDIFISGSDIYLSGGHISESGLAKKAVIWKNGSVFTERDVYHGTFASVFVVNNNVFAVGLESILLSPDPLPLGTRENHGTTLINNVFTTDPNFGTPGYGTGYLSVFVTE